MAGFGDIDVQPSSSATPTGICKQKGNVFLCVNCVDGTLKVNPSFTTTLIIMSATPMNGRRCGKLFYYIHHFNKHMIEEHNRHFECAECGKVFEIWSSWHNHMKIHKDIIYNCQEPSCRFSFRSKSRYKEHYKYFHRSSKTVKYRDCNQWFQTPSDK